MITCTANNLGGVVAWAPLFWQNIDFSNVKLQCSPPYLSCFIEIPGSAPLLGGLYDIDKQSTTHSKHLRDAALLREWFYLIS